MAYLLDSDVFIEGYKRYYAFDLCPGFWKWIEHQHRAGKLLSIQRVKEEIEQGDDQLVTWAKGQIDSFFQPTDEDTKNAFPVVTRWATSQNYIERAVSEFLEKADFFLVAHALAHSLTLVTHEQAAQTPSKIKIPNICLGLGIPVMNPFEMLRREGARFILEQGAPSTQR